MCDGDARRLQRYALKLYAALKYCLVASYYLFIYYLSNRKQRVMVDGKCSSWLNITSGVPQGSILGPLFFVIFISDLPEVVSQESSVALYADDCKAFRVVNRPNDPMMFQDDLDS